MIEESILENLKNSFSSAVQSIYIQSLGKTFVFREATVKEHTSLAKTVISSMNYQSVVYAATLSMMKNLCLDKNFDPMKMSEFDRLKVIVHLFSNNFFSKNLSVKCPHKACGDSVKYSMKYGSLLKMLDSVDCSDIVFDNETEMGTLRVTANFPRTSRYLSLLESVDGMSVGDAEKKADEKRKNDLRSYSDMDSSFSEIAADNENATVGRSVSADDDAVRKIRMRREFLKGKVKKSVEKKKDILGNVDAKSIGKDDAMLDLADIYMKRIQITGIKGSENEFDIDLSDFSYEDTEKILSVLPMNLFMKDDGTNVVKFIAKEIFKKMNACVPEIRCPKCGCRISDRLSLQDFFIFG